MAAPLLAAALAACSSAQSQTDGLNPAQQQQLDRYSSAPALLTQCAINNGATGLLSSAEQYNASNPRSQQWLFGRQVEPAGAGGSAFSDWFDNSGTGPAMIFGGQPIGDWPQWAATNRKLPAQVCGTVFSGAALRRLYAQVYRRWPAQLSHDPW